ncbi:hypothetical protein ACGFY6_30400 [Streptomyces sp. NPDC048387]|uniref:hypothetical protein n=1 Tax=Streptomyces sp. NPDC048387 TaxID=3365542 RepID=UPI00371E3151
MAQVLVGGEVDGELAVPGGRYVRRTVSPVDRRKVIVEPTGKPAGLDEAMAPARQQIGELLSGCTPQQLEVLFDYFTRATDAYRTAAEQIRDFISD